MISPAIIDAENPIRPSQFIAIPLAANGPIFEWIIHANFRVYYITAPNNGYIEEIGEEAVPEANYSLEQNDVLEKLESFEKLEESMLEAVNDQISNFNFNESNYGVLVPRKNGSYKLAQKYRPLWKVTSPAWAPLVKAGEITFDRVFGFSWRAGIYRGRRVHAFVAADNLAMKTLDHLMKMNLIATDLDLAYEVLGHLIDDNDVIYGLITEERTGRPYEYRDRTLVYDAISRLQQRGLMYKFAQPDFIFIQNGKVRLLDPELLIPSESEDAPSKDKYWEKLVSSFTQIKQFKGHVPAHAIRLTGWSRSFVLCATPSPEGLICLLINVEQSASGSRRKKKEGNDSKRQRIKPKPQELLTSQHPISSRESLIGPYKPYQPRKYRIQWPHEISKTSKSKLEEITNTLEDPFQLPDTWGDEELLAPFTLDT